MSGFQDDDVDWLKLEPFSKSKSGLFSQVTHILRVDTDGSQPPASGCDQVHNQAEVLVEYSAQYLFYGPPTEQ